MKTDSDSLDQQILKFRERTQALIEEYADNDAASHDSAALLASMNTMIEELQAASEELEQQNEDLLQMQSLLQQERLRYKLLYHAAPDAYLVTDRLGVISQANSAAGNLLNISPDRLVGKPLATFFQKDQLRALMQLLHAIDTGRPEQPQEWNTQLRPRDKSLIHIRVSVGLQNADNNGQEYTILWLLRDIDEEMRIQQQIFESRARYRAIFDSAAVGIALIGLDGTLLEVNPAFQRLFSHDTEPGQPGGYLELVAGGRPWNEPELFQELVRRIRPSYALEQAITLPGGKLVWIKNHFSLVLDAEGTPAYALGLFEDVTLLHQREEEILVLEHRLDEARDQERDSLARDLHDGPLQSAIGVLYRLQQFQLDHDASELHDELQGIHTDLDEIIHMLRSVSGMLRSPVLAHFGLGSAVRASVDRILTSDNNLHIVTQIEDKDWQLSPRAAQGIFRIYQHCMSNILRHAQARHVIVRLGQAGERLVLEIRDDGKGFSVPERWIDLTQEGHYGLIGSAERAAALGGELSIRSREGGGTTIRVSIPMDEAEQKKQNWEHINPKILKL